MIPRPKVYLYYQPASACTCVHVRACNVLVGARDVHVPACFNMKSDHVRSGRRELFRQTLCSIWTEGEARQALYIIRTRRVVQTSPMCH